MCIRFHQSCQALQRLTGHNNNINSRNDRNILYHAAPVSSRCYRLDAQTGAFFYNPGDYIYVYGMETLKLENRMISVKEDRLLFISFSVYEQ